jgi:1,4-dihydroxy-2-naphthoate octaprenyltransferase
MKLKQFNAVVEIRTKIISMGTFISATLFAIVDKGQWSTYKFVLMILAVLCVDMGTTGFNSYFDYINGTDNKKFNKEESKVLVHEKVDPKLALIVSSFLFLCAAILGFIIALQTSLYLIVVGAISMSIGYFYTGGPIPISRTPFGEIFAGGFLGTILFAISYYVQTLSFGLKTIIVSLPHLIIIGMILTVNNTCDRKSDVIAGRKTLAILLSEKAIIKVMALQLHATFLLATIYSLINLIPRPLLFFIPIAYILSLVIFKNMKKAGFSLETKDSSMKEISKIFLLYCLAFILGMVATLLI